MKYRPEIDGLRAVAVIPVIFFHAGFSIFGGGFVGVDIFFVISGYLITTIILSDMEQGTFSLVNFYERRARRILPPLFLVMLVSLPFAWLWLTPSDMKDFSQSLTAVSTFSSNILFWQESGYWEASSKMKPLLHTWSLAVEEQYYVLFPLFLMLMWRFKKRWIIGSLIVLAGISLAMAQWGAYNRPTPTFYLLPTRGWELAIGAAIALYFPYRKQNIQSLISHKLVNEMLGLLGLLMIGYAIFAFDETTPFPSLYTLIPTIGTGLIIFFSSHQTIVGRLLSTKALVAVGLISYSAYLWHQPLLAFARQQTLVAEPSELTYAIMAFLSIPLAYLSWRYVEKPFRTKGTFSRQAIFTYSIIASVAFIAIGLIGFLTNGFDARSTNSKFSANLIEHKLRVNNGLSVTCDSQFTLSPICRTDDKPEILIWGDSFAMHLVDGILASKPDTKMIQMTKSFCGPFFDIAPVAYPVHPPSWAHTCLKFTADVRGWLRENQTVKYVVLSSPFDQYLSTNNKLLLRSGEIISADKKFVAKEFEKTLNELRQMGVTPIVFSPPPTNGLELGRCLEKAGWRGMSLDNCDFAVSEISQNRLLVKELLKIIADVHTVVFLDDLLCSDLRCKTHFDDIFIFKDSAHFSHEGSAAVGKKFDFYRMIVEQ